MAKTRYEVSQLKKYDPLYNGEFVIYEYSNTVPLLFDIFRKHTPKDRMRLLVELQLVFCTECGHEHSTSESCDEYSGRKAKM